MHFLHALQALGYLVPEWVLVYYPVKLKSNYVKEQGFFYNYDLNIGTHKTKSDRMICVFLSLYLLPNNLNILYFLLKTFLPWSTWYPEVEDRSSTASVHSYWVWSRSRSTCDRTVIPRCSNLDIRRRFNEFNRIFRWKVLWKNSATTPNIYSSTHMTAMAFFHHNQMSQASRRRIWG